MKTGEIWEHKVSKNQYTILDRCTLRRGKGDWVDGIIYVADSGVFFTRSTESFSEKFKCIFNKEEQLHRKT